MIKRYDFCPIEDNGEWWCKPIETADGSHCAYSDVAQMIAERDALAQFAKTRKQQINELMDENEKLKAKLAVFEKSMMPLCADHDSEWCDK